jgi:hypothetical protein
MAVWGTGDSTSADYQAKCEGKLWVRRVLAEEMSYTWR